MGKLRAVTVSLVLAAEKGPSLNKVREAPVARTHSVQDPAESSLVILQLEWADNVGELSAGPFGSQKPFDRVRYRKLEVQRWARDSSV